MTQTVQQNSMVDIRFVLCLADGTVVDQTEGDETLQLRVGEGELLPALERCLIGMEAGERRSFSLQPDEAFGLADPANVTTLPLSQFPQEMELKEGLVIGFSGPQGEEIPGTILSVDEDTVTVDFNHPLAGHAIVFDVTVERIYTEPA